MGIMLHTGGSGSLDQQMNQKHASSNALNVMPHGESTTENCLQSTLLWALYRKLLLVKGYNEVVIQTPDGELICSRQRLTRIF